MANVKGLMSVHNKDDAIDKQIQLYIWHEKQDNKAILKHFGEVSAKDHS